MIYFRNEKTRALALESILFALDDCKEDLVNKPTVSYEDERTQIVEQIKVLSEAFERIWRA